MEKINIYDDFLTAEEMAQCRKIISTSNWEYGHDSNSNSSINTPFWYMELITYDFFKIQIKNKIEKLMNKKFNVLRVYANGQTFGQDGCYHLDSTSEKDTTFCVYITPVPSDSIKDLNGHILFRIPTLHNFIVGIEPLCNRAVSFPSLYYHRGTSFSRYFQNIRICIAFKLEEITE